MIPSGSTFLRCQKCNIGVLVPLSDYGPEGADLLYKAWVCTNPECGFGLRIRNGIINRIDGQIIR